MKYCFGDIVVVENEFIGVVLKSWIHSDDSVSYEVYVRMFNGIKEYPESKIERYMVRGKYLRMAIQRYS